MLYSTTMSAILRLSAALLLLTVSTSLADVFPLGSGYGDICQEIINGVTINSIEFKQRDPPCPQLNCPPAETISRATLCQRLTVVHNTYAAPYIGYTVSWWECMAALASPQPYVAADWNKWAGKHCGKWRQIDMSGTFVDNAVWHPATVTNNPSTGETFYRQNVLFDRPGVCCDDGWNESGGSYSQAWGWDPKDSADHGGYQGSCVGYSFTPTTFPQSSAATCLIWVTGQEAFLECVATGPWGRRRTSAGFWGHGRWSLHPTSTICRFVAAPAIIKQPLSLELGPPEGK